MKEEVHVIAIVGGGICGLATALALHRKGIGSLVLEKSETIQADGVAIGVRATGWRALNQLGVAAELREKANTITTFHDARQNRKKTTIVPFRKELRFLKRRDLIESMASNLPAGTIQFGYHIAEIAADSISDCTVLTTVDGNTIKAKVLIGCDGSNSVVAKYLGLPSPSYLTYAIVRGFTSYPSGHTFGNEFLHLTGNDFVAGHVPINDHLGYLFFRSNPSADIPRDTVAIKEFMREVLQECTTEMSAVVQHSDRESLNLTTKVWYRSPWQVMIGNLQKGTVTVAGDVMHVMGPFIGQGGSAGLEDAVVLAKVTGSGRAGRS